MQPGRRYRSRALTLTFNVSGYDDGIEDDALAQAIADSSARSGALPCPWSSSTSRTRSGYEGRK
jgi:hypothetical protein